MKVALICIAKNEDKYIQEWIDYHFKIGFDHIFIYANDWDYKNDNPNIKVIKYNGVNKQLSAYQHFIDNNIGIYDWGAFIDVDEFLVLKKHKNIKDFILECGTEDCLAVNWIMFGDNGLNEIEDGDYSVLNRFTKRSKTCNVHIKSICKITPDLFFLYPHSTNKLWVDPNGNKGFGPVNYLANNDVAQLNHYYCKTKKEFISKLNMGRADVNPSSYTFIPRTLNHFDLHNKNEVEDLLAKNLN